MYKGRQITQGTENEIKRQQLQDREIQKFLKKNGIDSKIY